MSFKAAALLVALASLAAPAGAADAPAAAWKFENPFCRVVAQMGPLVEGSGYGLALSAANGSALDAHVTLVGKTDAYDAHVNSGLTGPPEDRESPSLAVEVPADASISYFFVDSYSLDGGATLTCPSYVFSVGAAAFKVPEGVGTIEARSLQTVGALKCGHAYIAPRMRGQLESAVGAYGDRPLTVVGRAYLDSNGHSISENIVRTSGVEGMDSFLLGALHEHQFTPAQFLCTPVVGTIDVELKYFP